MKQFIFWSTNTAIPAPVIASSKILELTKVGLYSIIYFIFLILPLQIVVDVKKNSHVVKSIRDEHRVEAGAGAASRPRLRLYKNYVALAPRHLRDIKQKNKITPKLRFFHYVRNFSTKNKYTLE
jgi:hypothetical protein